MTQHLFDEVVGTPPPSTVDVHALVRREKRAQAGRRAGYGMMAVVALAVSAGVLVSVSGQDRNPHPAPPVAQGAPDLRFQLLANDKASAEATAKHLSAALNDALKRAAPEAKWVNVKDGGAADPTAEGLPHIAAVNLSDSRAAYFSGSVNVEAGKHVGVLSLTTMGDVGQANPRDPTNPEKKKQPIKLDCAGAEACTEGVAPNGQKTLTIAGQTGNVYLRSVRVGIPDNRILIIQVGSTNSNEAPLTVQQITAIVVDVAGYIKQ
ncbi:hypothetical protein ABT297_39850 [Dactylosporangium sp. NPDC000555]|uniref:hypothetical protein n=1 Tax=Dactylosporangium sp. NPDC000555 TaxID=3154260 RepID=UPI00332ACCC2